jgi:diacylglycerol kinase (ATP)
MKVALVINSESGRRFKKSPVSRLKQALVESNEVSEFFASTDEEIDNVGQIIRNKFEIVIICGGDGTVSRLSHHLVNSQTSIIIFPIGSGNDLANHLNMTQNVDKLIADIKDSKKLLINTIEINDGQYHVLTIACFAFEARVNRLATKLPRFLGGLKYTLATFICLWGKQYEDLEITGPDLQEKGSYSLAILANSPSFGGGMRISDKAHVNSDHLYLNLVSRVNKLKLIYLFLLLLTGKHYNRKEFRQFPIQSLEVRAIGSKLFPQADGDSLVVDDFKARILNDSLSIIECR